MNPLRTAILAAVATMMVTVAGSAQTPYYHTFRPSAISMRPAGLADAANADARDVTSMFWNPGSLAFLRYQNIVLTHVSDPGTHAKTEQVSAAVLHNAEFALAVVTGLDGEHEARFDPERIGRSGDAVRVLVDVTGKWTFAVVTENGTGTPAVVLKQEGEKLTGTYESARMGVRPIEGTVKKDSINFALKGGEVELRFIGVVVDKDNMKGIVDLAGQGSATFTGTRTMMVPTVAPELI